MNRLWVRLTLAFSIVTLLSVLVVALLANQRVSTDFRSFYVRSQVEQSGLLERLAQHYTAAESWAGVEEVFANAAMPGPGRGMGMGMGNMHMGARYTLTDGAGQEVYSNAPGQGAAANPDERLPVVADGRTLGYLLVSLGAGSELPQVAEEYLGQVNSALVQAGIVAVGLGLLFGLLTAWVLTSPLNRLAHAARRIARGHLDERVPPAEPAFRSEEVANLTTAFNDMAESLHQAEELRRGMVADIAHELRTPLTVVQGNLQAILDGVYPLERSEVAAIHGETVMLSRLVSDLHELAQAEAGKLHFQPRSLDVAGLLEEVGAVYREPAAGRGVEVRVASEPGLPPTWADPDRVRQVMHNLVANALRHTPDGGTLSLDARREGSSMVRVSVSDTGKGIATEDQPHVFDRFWRAERSRSREHGGSGLGLAIAKQIVQAQGGQIGVASEPGNGSTFWFTLPAVGRET